MTRSSLEWYRRAFHQTLLFPERICSIEPLKLRQLNEVDGWPTSACMLRVPCIYRRGTTSQHSRRILSTTSYQITSFLVIKKSSFKITSTNPLVFFSFKNEAQMFFIDHNGAFLQIIAVDGMWWKSFVRTCQISQQLKNVQNEAYGIVIWICEFSYRMHPCISKDEGRGKSTLLWLVALQHIRRGRNTSFTW